MKIYNNTYVMVEGEDWFKIIVTKVTDPNYYKEVLVDNSIQQIVKKVGVRVNKAGYVCLCKKGFIPIHHLTLHHTSNMSTVVDHINGNPLDNRKSNLRIVTMADNSNNRTRNPRSNTGIVGIARRRNGNYEYYRASVSDRTTLVQASKAKSQTKRYTKQFNITKLGEKTALNQAKEWLKQKRTEFNYV